MNKERYLVWKYQDLFKEGGGGIRQAVTLSQTSVSYNTSEAKTFNVGRQPGASWLAIITVGSKADLYFFNTTATGGPYVKHLLDNGDSNYTISHTTSAGAITFSISPSQNFQVFLKRIT